MVYSKPVKPTSSYEPLDDSLVSINTPVPSDDAARMVYVSMAFAAIELALLVRGDQLRGINPEYIPYVLHDRTYTNNIKSFLGRNLAKLSQPQAVTVLRNGFSSDYSSNQAELSYAKKASVYPFDVGELMTI